MVKNTGIVASEEHRREAAARANVAASTPVVRVGGAWLHESAQAAFGSWIDLTAQEYGLPAPKQDGDGDTIHYGMSAAGEFLLWEPDAEAGSGG